MFKRRRLARFVALAFVGGNLVQIAGCAAGLAPIVASFLESAVLSLLLGQLATL